MGRKAGLGPQLTRAKRILGEPFPENLCARVNGDGVYALADELGVTKATLYGWLKQQGIEQANHWARPGAAVVVVNPDGSHKIIAGKYTAAAVNAQRALARREA